MTQTINKNKFKFMCSEIDDYLFDIKRAMDVYIGLVRRESPDSVSVVEEQFSKVIKKIETLQKQGRTRGVPEGLSLLKSAVASCEEAQKRLEVGVNQFSQTQISVDVK